MTATLAPIEPATPDVPPSLTSRFFTRRTVASLIAAGVLVAFAVARAPINWGEAWSFHQASMAAYGEQCYAEALESVRGGLEHTPDHPGLNYNYACFAALAGDSSDETFAHLRRSVELFPSFREQARRDDDFTSVRDDPRFEEALR